MNETFKICTKSVETGSDVSVAMIVTIIYAIIEIFGLCGNILVLLTVIYGQRRFQTHYYRLVFHLAICDIFLLLVGNVFFIVAPWLKDQNWSSSLGTATCHMILPLVGCVFITELALLVIIGILRHQAVTKPLEPRLSGRKLKYIITLVYIAPLFFYFPVFFSQQVTNEEYGYYVCESKWKDNLYFNIFSWILSVSLTFIPMVFLIVLYTKMCYSITLHQKNLKKLFSAETTHLTGNLNTAHHISIRHRQLHVEKNTKMIIVSVIVLLQFLIAVVPVQVLSNLVLLGREDDKFHLVWMLPLYFLVSCSFNPIVYGFGDKTIRKGYKEIGKKIFSC